MTVPAAEKLRRADLCPDCKGTGQRSCPGPSSDYRTQRERDAAGLVKGVDYCYGLHMGHSCDHPNAPTIAKLLAIGEAVWTAEFRSVRWDRPDAVVLGAETVMYAEDMALFLRSVES